MGKIDKQRIEEYRKWLTEMTKNHYSTYGAIGGTIENEVYRVCLKKFNETFGDKPTTGEGNGQK